MTIYEYPKCTTCKNALKWLDENGISYETRDIREQNPTVEDIKRMYAKTDLPLKRFFNTCGFIYKGMGLKDKLADMTEEEQMELLATDGMLVKRPIIEGEDFVMIGFREKNWREKFK